MMKRNCKQWYTLKNTAFIATLFIVTGVFTACGKSDKEDIAKDLGVNATSDAATKSDAVQEPIPENLSYTVKSVENGAVKVEAEVYSEGYGQVPTYKLKKRDKNDEWVKSYAEKLFDNGEYINVKPYDFCSIQELETEKQFWEERLDALDESNRGYERVQTQVAWIEYRMEHFSESNYVKYPEGQLVFTGSNSGNEDNVTSYSERAQLRGEVNGDVWLLNYDYRVYDKGGNMAPVLYGSCVEKLDYISASYGMDVGIYKNKCDRGEAESEAARLLDRLGFNNMECVKMTELQPAILSRGDYLFGPADYFDGYCIIYGPSLNNVKMFSCLGEGISADGENFAVQPCVSILVNSEGAYSFCIIEDYDVEGMLSENSRMLSFQQIDDIAHGEFEKMMNERPNTSYNITKIKFEYLCVTYDGLSYAMIPVWTYYMEWINYGDTVLYPVLIVNSLDGAIISSEDVSCNWEYYDTMR